MKQFTEKDVQNGRIFTDTDELVYAPLPWHDQGLWQTASGYGKKLTLRWKIHYCGRLYRLYCTSFANAASVWFMVKGRTINIS